MNPVTHPFTFWLLAVLIGAAVTWLVAWFYYKRAGDELLREARALHAASAGILHKLQFPADPVTPAFDAEGRVTETTVGKHVSE